MEPTERQGFPGIASLHSAASIDTVGAGYHESTSVLKSATPLASVMTDRIA